MKTLILAITLLPILAQSQGIAFQEMDWEAIKTKAKQENKPIFVDTYASWCEPCKWMDQNTFSQATVGDFFNKNYISWKVDVEKGKGQIFAQDFKINSYPTLLYFSANGELLHRMIGAFQVEELIQKSKDALVPEKQIYTLQKRFDAGERNADFLYQYTYALFSVNEEYEKVAAAYLESQPKETWATERNFKFLEQFFNDYKSEPYKYVIANKAKFVLALSSPRVEAYLDAAFKIRCFEIVENASDKTVVRDFLQDVKDILPEKSEYFKTRIDFYYNRGDAKKDYKLAQKHEKHCKDAKSLDGLARYLLDMYGESKTHLEAALQWANKAVVLEESVYYLETQAKILLALGDKETAMKSALKQLEISKKEGKYIEQTEALILKIKG